MTFVADTIWAVLAVLAVGLEVVAHAQPRRVAGAVVAVRSLVRRPGWRLAGFVGWMWLGWHLFAR